MGQVPNAKKPTPSSARFLIVGSGRLAQHLQHYFQLLDLDFNSWSRKSDSQNFEILASKASHILLAVSDSAIAGFYQSRSQGLRDKIWVHFSGASSYPGLHSCHPLMSFGHEPYDLEQYLQIPFILDEGSSGLEALLPGLKNPCYFIPAERRALYHAYCVMSGNFTQLLWWMTQEAFSTELGLPKEALLAYQSRVFENSLRDPRQSLTGPLVRGDQTTISRHLDVLSDVQVELYRSFIHLYETLNPNPKISDTTRGEPHEHTTF